MSSLNALVEEAQSLAGVPDVIAQANRQLTVCNACRYCEGYCATMQAMARRLDFTRSDIDYLANLCHNCGACLHACQYAAPHEFAIHIPQALAAVRTQTYAEHAWPRAMAGAYRRNGVVVSVVLTLVLAVFLLALGAMRAPSRTAESFYAVMSHSAMVSVFLPVFAFAMLAMVVAAWRFWRSPPTNEKGGLDTESAGEATLAALTLRYLDGGHGEGCANETDAPSHARRWFHHATFYGFMLCFAATSIATLYHYALGRPAPYAWHDLPKLLGIVGGVGLIVGPLGLLVLYLRRNLPAARQGMDIAFLLQLLLVSLTGFVLMFARGTAGLSWALAIHLGCVMTFFLTMPYSKFVHGLFRGLALLRFSMEKRQPLPNALGKD